jgi:hypothetical protein
VIRVKMKTKEFGHKQLKWKDKERRRLEFEMTVTRVGMSSKQLDSSV